MEYFVYFIVLCFIVSRTNSANYDPKNGYSAVTVALTNDVTATDLENLKDFFEKANLVLHKATRERTKLYEVVFLLNSPVQFSENVSWEAFEYPDIQFTDDKLRTIQTPFCGEHGLSIKFPRKLLLDEYGPKTFVQQWAKYRFGIFDEISYEQPETKCFFHEDEEKWHLTGCYNKEPKQDVEVHFGEMGLPICKYPSDLKQMFDGVDLLSSLSFSSVLPKVEQFCDGSAEHPHNPSMPTIHNALCNGRATWDVIQGSYDLNGYTDHVPISKPLFRFVHESSPRFVFAIQMTDFKMFLKIWPVFVNLIENLLPEEFEVAVVYFTDNCTASTQIRMTKLNSEEAKINIKKNFTWIASTGSNLVCPENAIAEAIAILKGDSRPDTIIFFGVANKFVKKVEDMETTYKKELHECRISGVLFVDDKDELTRLDRFFATHRGSLYPVPEKGHWMWLLGGMVASINTRMKEYISVIHQQSELKSNYPEEIEFYAKRDAVGELLFEASCEQVQGIKIIFFDGKEIKMDADTNTIRTTTAVSASNRQWYYSFQFQTENPIKCDIMALLRNVDPLKSALVRFYTKAHQIYNHTVHVIYIHVDDDLEITEIKVMAKGFPKEETLDLNLNDKGNGDPDFEANDRIYSGYFVRPSQESSLFYTLAATISFPANSHQREDENVTIHYQMDSLVTPYETVYEKFRPSRISNFRAHFLSKASNELEMEWTAPGGFLDHKQAKRYDVRYAPSFTDLLNFFEKQQTLKTNENREPKLSGERERVKFNLPDPTQKFFFVAIRAVNAYELKGMVSNIVKVTMPPDPETTTATPGSSNTGTLDNTNNTESANTTPSTNLGTTRIHDAKYTSTETGYPGHQTTTEQVGNEFWTKEMVIIISASSFGGFALILVIVNVVVWCIVFRKRKAKHEADNNSARRKSEIVRISYATQHENEQEQDKLTPLEILNAREEDDSARDTQSDLSGAPYHFANPNLSTPEATAPSNGFDFNKHIEKLANSDFCFNGHSSSTERAAPKPPDQHRVLSPAQLMHQPLRRYTPANENHQRENQVHPNSGSRQPTFSTFHPYGNQNGSTRPNKSNESHGGNGGQPYMNSLRDSDNNSIYGGNVEATNPILSRMATIPITDSQRNRQPKSGAVNESFDYGVV